MLQYVIYMSQTCHKSLNDESIFKHFKTRHINCLYKIRIYFTLIKMYDVLKYSQFTIKKVMNCL